MCLCRGAVSVPLFDHFHREGRLAALRRLDIAEIGDHRRLRFAHQHRAGAVGHTRHIAAGDIVGYEHGLQPAGGELFADGLEIALDPSLVRLSFGIYFAAHAAR